MTDDEIIDRILVREGGGVFTQDPLDRGGTTKWGLTMATLAAHRGHPVNPSDVMYLEEGEARLIYQRYYVAPFTFVVNDALRELLIDSAVQHGVKNAVKLLQEGAGVAVDGILGPVTRGAVVAQNPGPLRLKVFAARMRFYGNLITRIPNQARFAAGWLNRLSSLL